MALEVNNLSFSYGNELIFQNVSFIVENREIGLIQFSMRFNTFFCHKKDPRAACQAPIYRKYWRALVFFFCF